MTSYRYLGSALTNANGVATFDYEGTGAGEIDVIASLDKPITDGSIVSETLPVLDTLLYDTGTDPNHNIWTGDTSNLTRNSEYSRLEESATPTPTATKTPTPTPTKDATKPVITMSKASGSVVAGGTKLTMTVYSG